MNGLRYLNLSGLARPLASGELQLRGRFCRVQGEPLLSVFREPDYRHQRVMVIAPTPTMPNWLLSVCTARPTKPGSSR